MPVFYPFTVYYLRCAIRQGLAQAKEAEVDPDQALNLVNRAAD